MTLPYPGHTWPLSQHAVALSPSNLFGLLRAAQTYEGATKPSKKINEFLVRAGVLTKNIRKDSGKIDAWRDYQQLLAELGLIYSTKIAKTLTVTTIGKQLLDGEIGYSELLTSQAFKYQYPNGFKYDLSPRMKEYLKDTHFAKESSLILVQKKAGVLIKPAILILRVILELFKVNKNKAYLDVVECQNFLVPIRTNSEWTELPREILHYRLHKGKINPSSHSRRNVQDWYKLLEKTDIFVRKGSRLWLNPRMSGRIQELINICDENEKVESFWIPYDASVGQRIAWFDYYGNSDVKKDFVEPYEELSPDYITSNYLSGFEDSSEIISCTEASPISLQEFSPAEFAAPCMNERHTSAAGTVAKTHTKKILHESMLASMATILRNNGAEISMDPSSIDLYVTYNKREYLFEVKTITKRNFLHRLRLGIGQLLEYDFRWTLAGNHRANLVLVINSLLDDDSWVVSFFRDFLRISLVCLSGRTMNIHSNDDTLKIALKHCSDK